MKKSILFLLIVTALGISLTSCSKKNESGDDDISTDFLIKGTVDGQELICPTGTAGLSSDLKSLHVVGRIKSGDTFTGLDLFIFPFTGKGTYALGGNSPHIGQYYLTAGGNTDNAYSTTGTGVGDGKITVDSYDNDRAAGTFEFTAGNTNGGSKKITKGSFSFKITTIK